MRNSIVDSSGKLAEAHTLKGGEIVWLYSSDLHKMNFVASLYGLDLTERNDFEAAKKKIRTIVNSATNQTK